MTMQIPLVLQTTVLPARSNVFMTLAVFYMNQPMKLDYLWAALCIMGAVYFMFRG